MKSNNVARRVAKVIAIAPQLIANRFSGWAFIVVTVHRGV
jgi:hypothetical protein